VEAVRCQRGSNHVLSLSGGVDSRAVGAAMNRAELRFAATTYSDAGGRAKRDVAVARQLAEVLGVQWHLCQLQPPTGADYSDLLSFRYGANNLRMSFILPYLRWIREEAGPNAVQFTGDGGLVMKSALPPKKRLAGASAVAEHLVGGYPFFSVADASELTGQPHQHLIDRLVARIDEFPESNPADKVAHFRIYEHAINRNFEGEDRNRYFVWSCAPLCDWRFVSEAMACTEAQRAYHRLYAALLTDLDVSVAEMPRAEFGGAITNRRYRFLRRIEAYLGLMPDLERVVQRLRKGRRASPPRPDPWKLRAIRARALDGAGASLWGGRLIPWLDARRDALSRNQVEALLTVVSLAQLLERGTVDFDEARTPAGPRAE